MTAHIAAYPISQPKPTSTIQSQQIQYVRPARHLEGGLLLLTSCWSLYNLVISQSITPTLVLAYFGLLIASLATHLLTAADPLKIGGIFFIPNALYRGGADPGLLVAALLPPLVLAAEIISANSPESKSLWSNYLGLSLINGLSLLAQCCFNRVLLPGRRLRAYAPMLVLLLALSKFILTSRSPVHYTASNIAIHQALMWVMAHIVQGSFTLGEIGLICQGLTFMILETGAMLSNSGAFGAPLAYGPTIRSYPPEFILLFGLILGMLLIGLSVMISLRPLEWVGVSSKDRLLLVKTGLFYLVAAGVVLAVIRPVMASLLLADPFEWMINYLLNTPATWILISYWLVAVVLAIGFSTSVLQGRSLNTRRKYFHGLATLLFVPGYFIESRFLYIALAVALSGFILLEYIRAMEIGPFHPYLHGYLSSFVDEKDPGLAILAHLYLLMGCALPIWLSARSPASALSGILVLGVGDTAASVVGKRYGSIRWPGSSKTVQGTMGFILSLELAILVVQPRLLLSSLNSALATTTITIFTGLLEAWSFQNDNLVLPLYLFATLQLARSI